MAKREMPKRRRAPGGGRKPAGPFSELREVMSIRVTTEMRDNLAKAATANKRSVTQELLHRLQWSFDEDHKNYRDPATAALCFLFADLAENVHGADFEWRSDPFLFQAFKIGVSKMLDGLPQPAGKVEKPALLQAMLERLSADNPTNKTEWVKRERELLTQITKSPEAWGADAAGRTLAAYFKPSIRYKDFEPRQKELDAMTSIPGLFSKVLRHQENTFYRMERARRDLDLKPRRRKP